MTRAGLIFGALVVIGLVTGLRAQLAPTSAPVHEPPAACPQCEVLDVDLHAHTRFSDGFLSPMELVLAAKRQHLDAIAVTEHNLLFPATMAAWFSELVDGPIILRGQEVTSRDYHLIAVGLSERVAPQRDLRAVVDEVHRQGGLAIAAHPTQRYWPAFEAVRDELDAAEVVHPAAFSGSEAFSWADMVDFFEREGRKPLTAVGSSDFHFFRSLGICRTEVFVEERSKDAILAALRDGATRVRAPNGRLFGRWDGDTPTAPASLGQAYAPLDTFDAIGRLLGWIGIVGLMIFRSRAPARRTS